MHRSLLLILLLLTLPLSACGLQANGSPPIGSKTLTVLAAASLTESFGELGQLFETRHPGVKVVFSFGGSQQLAQQLGQGASADVFASASPKYMEALVPAQRVNAADVKTFAQNRLVVITPKENPAELKQLKDLARPGLKLDLADKTVPAGQYSLDFLDKAAQAPGFDAQFKSNVLKNVVSYEDNVRSVVAKVALGEADAGIVYASDITASQSAKIGRIEIPDALNVLALYPIAPLADSQNMDLARAFVSLALSPEGQEVLARYGFLPVEPGS